MESKKCIKCSQVLPLSEYYIKDKRTGRLFARCKNCHYEHCKETRNPERLKKYQQEYYKKNKSTMLEKQKKRYSGKNKQKKLDMQRRWRKNNRDFANKLNREYKKSLRNKFLDMYGRECACCGETGYEFLTIEHIKGQRGVKSQSGNSAYKIAIEKYRPDLYEVLCMNCNFSKGRYGYCPHQNTNP